MFKKVPAPAPGEDAGPFVQIPDGGGQDPLQQEGLSGSSVMCQEILALLPDNLEAKNLLAEIQAAQTPEWLQFLKDMKNFLPTLVKATGMTLLLVLHHHDHLATGRPLHRPGQDQPHQGPLVASSGASSGFSGARRFCSSSSSSTTALPSMGITLKPFTAAVLGLGLNYSAYLAEIMRGAIESIDAGQMEAAKAIGMTYWQAMRRIIIPQTYKRLVPPVGNEFIALIKDTALVSTIAMVELMRAANQIFSATFNVFILVQAAIIYLVLTSIFTVSFRKLEDRLGVYENR
ncbi:MAG: amino acid ABC transporter permease [Candidatus Moduliflexus flocculans]|nr:amino acid ABC transporter permease [Candidatus Moduliflexus flocculans]